MTVLPILLRELRARGHSPANYWGRMAVAGVAVLVVGPFLMAQGPVAGPVAGRSAFIFLVGTAFLLCCGASLLTADAISRERRQGTLVLLLLTRINLWDVLLGKLASNGLACFAGLFAFLPVLAISLLAGGTSAGEAARNAAALLNLLFLALVAGLCASCLGLDRFRTSCVTLFTMAVFVLAPFLGGRHAALMSPLGTLVQSADRAYKIYPPLFWISLCLVQVLAWALLWGAVALLRRRTAQPEDAAMAGEPSSSVAKPSAGPAVDAPSIVSCRYCGRKNAVDAVYCYECGTELFPRKVELPKWTPTSAPSPLHWLLGRQRGIQPMLWLAAFISAAQFALVGLGSRFLGVGGGTWFLGFYWGFGFVAMAAAGALVACAASRFVVEAQRTGELELLLTTPLGAESLASTQWDMLKRIIRLPLLVMLSPFFFQGAIMLMSVFSQSDSWKVGYALSVLLGIAVTILGVGALCWLALWFGFQGLGQGRTIIRTVVVAKGLPYLLSLASGLLLQFMAPRQFAFPNRWSVLPLLLGTLAPQVAILLFYVFLIRLARSHLLHRRPVEPFDARGLLRRGLPGLAAVVHRARRWPER